MEGNFFHILNRGVEKRKIFLDKEDYLRFIHNLRDLNDKSNVMSYFDRRLNLEMTPPSLRRRKRTKRQKDELTDVLCWTLMPNHPHIFVQEKIDGGASIYTRKLTGGYTMYFNQKHERSGTLFQGRSKIILIERDAHFLHIPYYIFSNPIKLIESEWKEKGIKNLKKVIEFLENYKYSSLPDIIGKNNFPEIINKKLFYEIYDTNEKKFKKDFIEWLEGFKGDLTTFND